MNRSLKFLLYLLLLAGIAGSGIWIVGSKKGRYPTNLLINATPAQIFPYIRDYELIKQWKSNLVDIQSTSAGHTDVGTEARMIVDQDGKHIKFNTRVIRFNENELLTIQASNSTQIRTSVFQLDEKEDGTTYLTYRVRTQNQGLGKFIGPFSKTDLSEQVVNDARRLKKLVETNAAADPGADNRSAGAAASENLSTQ